jgi:hypothetical protein
LLVFEQCFWVFVLGPPPRAPTTGARPLAQNGYKIELAQGLVRQALQSLR